MPTIKVLISLRFLSLSFDDQDIVGQPEDAGHQDRRPGHRERRQGHPAQGQSVGVLGLGRKYILCLGQEEKRTRDLPPNHII